MATRPVTVLIPSIRPERWRQVRANIRATTDQATVSFLDGRYPSYATAVNAGWQRARSRYVLLGSDDLEFHDGWLDHALELMGDGVEVVGTNDLHNPYVVRGEHSTHPLIDRRYLQRTGGVWDGGQRSCLFPYDHNYTDCEFVETARARQVFAPCLKSRVEHKHPDFGNRERDRVDRRTRRSVLADWETFMARREMWVDDLDVVHEYVRPIA